MLSLYIALLGILLPLAVCKLEKVVIITRVGAKPPVNYELLSNASSASLPLSPAGLRQMYMMGTEFRHRYIEKAGLLSSSYNTSEVKVITSDTSRAYQSVVSLLYGLYPPTTGQVILDPVEEDHATPPFHPQILNQMATNSSDANSSVMYSVPGGIPVFNIETIHRANDYYFRASKPSFCPRLKEIYVSLMKSPEFNKLKTFFDDEVFPVVKAKLENCVNTTNWSAANVSAVRRIWKNYQSNIFHGINVPAFGELETSKMMEFENRMQYDLHYKQQLIRKVATSKIFGKIAKFFKSVNHGGFHHSEKIIIFSGHRSTIQGVLANLFSRHEIMELLKDKLQLPNFGSTVVLELHSTAAAGADKKPQNHVHIFVNDREVEIKQCGHPCRSQDFLSILHERTIPRVKKFCKSQ